MGKQVSNSTFCSRGSEYEIISPGTASTGSTSTTFSGIHVTRHRYGIGVDVGNTAYFVFFGESPITPRAAEKRCPLTENYHHEAVRDSISEAAELVT